jgi:serpin B
MRLSWILQTWLRPLVFCGLLLLLLSCTAPATHSEDADTPPLPAIPLTTAGQAIAQANNQLGFNLLQQLRASAPESNIFFSPLSIALVMQLAYNGADGESANEMAQVLHVADLDLSTMNEGSQELQTNLRAAANVELLIANSIWVSQGFALLDPFLERSRRYYNAEAAELDFASPAALERINGWVAEGTKGKIAKLFDALEPDTLTYLINTVYFKGSWSDPFDPARTRDMPFKLTDGTEMSVPMMAKTATYSTTFQENFAALSLPYGDSRMRMVVILPNEQDALAEVLDQVTAASWQNLLDELDAQQENVSLYLPRFKLEFDEKLNEALIALGMERAFEEIDFANMVDGGGIFISYIRHKAIVEVNEEGTVAVAASIAAMPTSSPPPFVVDRPFFFAIQDTHTGVILFMGAVYAPEPLTQ